MQRRHADTEARRPNEVQHHKRPKALPVISEVGICSEVRSVCRKLGEPSSRSSRGPRHLFRYRRRGRARYRRNRTSPHAVLVDRRDGAASDEYSPEFHSGSGTPIRAAHT